MRKGENERGRNLNFSFSHLLTFSLSHFLIFAIPHAPRLLSHNASQVLAIRHPRIPGILKGQVALQFIACK